LKGGKKIMGYKVIIGMRKGISLASPRTYRTIKGARKAVAWGHSKAGHKQGYRKFKIIKL
jgi:hypothetical protein